MSFLSTLLKELAVHARFLCMRAEFPLWRGCDLERALIVSGLCRATCEYLLVVCRLWHIVCLRVGIARCVGRLRGGCIERQATPCGRLSESGRWRLKARRRGQHPSVSLSEVPDP